MTASERVKMTHVAKRLCKLLDEAERCPQARKDAARMVVSYELARIRAKARRTA